MASFAASSAANLSPIRAVDYNEPVADPRLVACLHCDLVQRLPELDPGASARCPRCDKELCRRRADSLNRTLAFAVAGAFLFVVANSVPMLGLSAVGHHASTTVFGGARQLWQDEREGVAVLVFCTAILAPALQIAFMLLIVGGTLRERPAPWVATLLRHHPHTRTWSMIEVMMLGVLVALIKIADYATVVPGLAMFVLGALVVDLAAMQAAFDPHEVWRRVEWANARAAAAAAPLPSPEPA